MALDIKLLRSAIAQRDKERAERATLVAQEKLVGGGGEAAWCSDGVPCQPPSSPELEGH